MEMEWVVIPEQEGRVLHKSDFLPCEFCHGTGFSREMPACLPAIPTVTSKSTHVTCNNLLWWKSFRCVNNKQLPKVLLRGQHGAIFIYHPTPYPHPYPRMLHKWYIPCWSCPFHGVNVPDWAQRCLVWAGSYHEIRVTRNRLPNLPKDNISTPQDSLL